MTKGTKRFVLLCEAVRWANKARVAGFDVKQRGHTVWVG